MTTLIIGGGWSGLAAAVTLVKQGRSVHLIESAKQLGGRARNINWQDKTIDNGQHLMIGAYCHTLTMMKQIGVNVDSVFERLPLDITIYDAKLPSIKLSAKNCLPWRASLAWSLIKSVGLWGALSAAKLQANIPTLLANNDITASEWLANNKQPDRLIKQLWAPLCLATLNTPINESSAHILARVLKDSLGQHKACSDLLIPKQTLGDLFPHVAARYIEQYGGRISLQTRAKKIAIRNNKVEYITLSDGQKIKANDIIVATSPSQAAALLLSHTKITVPNEYPIYTVYLQYPDSTRLPSPLVGITGTLSQWVFDRSDRSLGLIAVVISSHGKHEHMPKSALIDKICQELHQILSLPIKAQDSFLVCEKRATFACKVGIEKNRPAYSTDIEGLWLAGDFVANGYPATLEGAILNGEYCAKQLLS